MRAADIRVGTTHGRWTVTGPFQRLSSGAALFPCRCECGTEKLVRFKGRFVGLSCGCLQREVASHVQHGGSKNKEPLYGVWRGIRDRCTNPNRKEYPNYGRRGIAVCPEWDDYAVFRDWALEHGYGRGLDLDRIDNNGDYSPENCRFVTRSQNLRNKRTNRLLTAVGDTKSMADWADDSRCLVEYKTLEGRLRLGWSIEDAITTPKGRWNPARSA